MSEVLVRCENVSKIFCRDLKRSLWYGVRDVASEMLLRDGKSVPKSSAEVTLRKGEFWANRDISFELKRGECLGLIGRNGAGKTTLLKMLNGLIKPDTGRIEMRGRVGALIALGAGFNPILTGRENVFVNGSVLGMSRRGIRDKFDEIVEFAELSDFIDAPVRTYSSGMQVRLGFAVAALLMKPDVFLLDEVLAVGDASFRSKCYQRLGDLVDQAAVILVSHNLDHIHRVCQSGIVLNKGEIYYAGDASEACGRYLGIEMANQPNHGFLRLSPPVDRFEMDCQLLHRENSGIRFHFDLTIENSVPVQGYMKFQLQDYTGQLCLETRSDQPLRIDLSSGKSKIKLITSGHRIKPGGYFISFLVYSPNMVKTLIWSHRMHPIEINGIATAKSANLAEFEEVLVEKIN